jgi:hypothetical protein
MKKYSYLIIIVLISSLVLTGCLLSNVGQVPATEQSGITYLTKAIDPDPGLVGLWHFDEGSGTTANDSSGNGLNGTVTGASYVGGVSGQALSFDGDDYVMVPDSSLLEPSEVTVEAWVKRLGSPGGAKYIVSKYLPNKYGSYSSYGLYTGSGGIRFYIGYTSSWIGSPQASAAAVWDGKWHHVAGTFDGVNIKLYLDGVQVDGATSTIQDIYYFGTGNLYIGAYTNSSYLAFSGTIDEVRIWSSALTADQLDDRMAPAITITTPVSVATYLLNQTVNADWSAWDGTGTGVASETGTVASGSPINTTTVGSKDFIVTAMDYAKNTDSKTVTYYVNYVFNGFLPPVSLGKPFKLGSTIPVKFQLTDALGAVITNASPSISLELLSEGTPTGDVIYGDSSGAANTGSIFRYDPNSYQYIFNLATKGLTAPATYRITVDLRDGTTQQVDVGLK